MTFIHASKRALLSFLDGFAPGLLPDGTSDPRALAVEGDTLDAICSAYGFDRVDFLKMNIEGAERYAIGGMTETIKRTSAAAVAAHDFRANGRDSFFKTRAIVQRFLERNGFETVTRARAPRPWIRDILYGVRRPNR